MIWPNGKPVEINNPVVFSKTINFLKSKIEKGTKAYIVAISSAGVCVGFKEYRTGIFGWSSLNTFELAE